MAITDCMNCKWWRQCDRKENRLRDQFFSFYRGGVPECDEFAEAYAWIMGGTRA